MQVFVLLFNARTDNEEIYTLQKERNTVLMFTSEDDATRYALMLEAQDFPTPTVEAIDSEEVIAFCRDGDYDWEIIEQDANTLIIPPKENASSLDEATPAANQPDSPTEEKQENATSEMSSSELDDIRRQLERLL